MEQARKIWEEMIQVSKSDSQERLEDEMTVYEFITMIHKETGEWITRDRARKYLEKGVAEGKLTKRKVYLKPVGAKVALYRPVVPSVL